jgi:hypothetical protein
MNAVFIYLRLNSIRVDISVCLTMRKFLESETEIICVDDVCIANIILLDSAPKSLHRNQ